MDVSAQVSRSLPPEDLEFILQKAESTLRVMQDSRIFISGGTGFFGRWILETLQAANRALRLNLSVVVLSRRPEKFLKQSPSFGADALFFFQKGDIENFEFPAGSFDFVIHAATETNSDLSCPPPLKIFDVGVNGTRRCLEFAMQAHVKRFLFLSSGAVYGQQVSSATPILENVLLAEDSLTPYGRAKQVGEFLCREYSSLSKIEPVFARCFAFVGPTLPMQSGYAIGNFLHDAISRKNILIRSDGLACRSYLYAADLVVWLLRLLVLGERNGAYNVGSDIAISIKDLAKQISSLVSPAVEVEIQGKACPQNASTYYVPDISRARELGLEVWTSLENSLRKTVQWLI